MDTYCAMQLMSTCKEYSYGWTDNEKVVQSLSRLYIKYGSSEYAVIIYKSIRIQSVMFYWQQKKEKEETNIP